MPLLPMKNATPGIIHNKIPPNRRDFKSLTKSMIWQTETSPASQGGEAAKKGAYTDVSDRILQPTPTQKAKMAACLQPFLRLQGLSAV